MPFYESLTLPPGWRVREVTGKIADLRVAQSSKNYLVAVVAVSVAALGVRLLLEWKVFSTEDFAVHCSLILLLVLVALWCTFADEVWHLESNLVVHRIGIGKFVYSQQYRDAELEIVQRFSRNFSVPYCRLYAVSGGRHHFLIERKDEELRQLAKFIAFYTGWPVRSY